MVYSQFFSFLQVLTIWWKICVTLWILSLFYLHVSKLSSLSASRSLSHVKNFKGQTTKEVKKRSTPQHGRRSKWQAHEQAAAPASVKWRRIDISLGGAVKANFLYRVKLIFRGPKQYIFLNDISATTTLKTTTKAIQLTAITTTRRIHFIYDSSWDKATMERISSVRESFCSEDGEEVSTCFLSSHRIYHLFSTTVSFLHKINSMPGAMVILLQI